MLARTAAGGTLSWFACLVDPATVADADWILTEHSSVLHKQLGLPILGRHILHDGQINELPRAVENLRQSRLCRFQGVHHVRSPGLWPAKRRHAFRGDIQIAQRNQLLINRSVPPRNR
jgi:hypothetical protein